MKIETKKDMGLIAIGILIATYAYTEFDFSFSPCVVEKSYEV